MGAATTRHPPPAPSLEEGVALGGATASGERAPSSSSASGPQAVPATVQLFVLVHGICGSPSDWDVWVQRLARTGREDFVVRPSRAITAGAWFAGQEIRRLGHLLAEEVVGWLHEFVNQGTKVVLHFICHSLGGLVMRAALPHICDAVEGEPKVTYGQVLTLNTPHLGVYGGNFVMRWKNFGKIVPSLLFKQIHQMTLQDAPGSAAHYSSKSLVVRPQDQRPRLLEELANPRGKACACLARFQRRTAVAATHWDVVVPFCTAAICSENPFPAPCVLVGDLKSFWRVEAATGFKEGTQLGACQAAAGPAGKAFAAANRLSPGAAREVSAASTGGRSLRTEWAWSSDGEVAFPVEMLAGLTAAAPWQRVAYTLHQPWWGAGDVHLFSIGKDRKVLHWSIEFIDLLISIFLEEA